jgi:hypothetical protein
MIKKNKNIIQYKYNIIVYYIILYNIIKSLKKYNIIQYKYNFFKKII